MDWLILLGCAVAAVVAILLTTRGSGRSSGGSSGVFGAIDEVFAPNRHSTMLEYERQTELPAPAPAPGDKDFDAEAKLDPTRGRWAGTIRIDI
ncbi:hypothetical protein [Naasia lichenicola]|uniref:Uncharacterized protein n=1 Tax=Naasia lichenicola TaxID=2565933 RepID=A0A4S4FF41_9MICO|nr:hypothetical protein [Naasia lichenicola]THG28598.1 hypothetical protein E6C64_17505 [Naasia lichenicola]